jgi:hypothetical protein
LKNFCFYFSQNVFAEYLFAITYYGIMWDHWNSDARNLSNPWTQTKFEEAVDQTGEIAEAPEA